MWHVRLSCSFAPEDKLEKPCIAEASKEETLKPKAHCYQKDPTDHVLSWCHMLRTWTDPLQTMTKKMLMDMSIRASA